ncbi:hypothetical protein [Novosphingobium album (ex Hu et al. 2023)]|uniref:Uncharacterized protein n=1 Tax=Novosphingobium album (ex Hu et al. 2023) TaxID=2930093 RepID=A0ABT0B3Z6_9SPHN|nr:hypothetical protein [Novosphingobium album (ex Hu et al. 2023)]MCJ2179598.1 hypothetical protein [Novosphingobium album (ex Hu et al. 2023)]
MAEMVVAEALATLSEIASSGARSLLPHLVGQRFEALRAVVGSNGPLSDVGCRVADVLEEFYEFHRYRTYLCHGVSDLSFGHNGDWLITLHMTNFSAGIIKRSNVSITATQAALLLEQLRSARQRLDGQLRGMLAALNRMQR